MHLHVKERQLFSRINNVSLWKAETVFESSEASCDGHEEMFEVLLMSVEFYA